MLYPDPGLELVHFFLSSVLGTSLLICRGILIHFSEATALQTFFGICFLTLMGSWTQMVRGNSLHSFLGTLMGTSVHFFSGTSLHLVRGTCFSIFFGTCLHFSLGTFTGNNCYVQVVNKSRYRIRQFSHTKTISPPRRFGGSRTRGTAARSWLNTSARTRGR